MNPTLGPSFGIVRLILRQTTLTYILLGISAVAVSVFTGIQRKVSATLVDRHEAPLLDAVRLGDRATVISLLQKGVPLSTKLPDGTTVLMEATVADRVTARYQLRGLRGFGGRRRTGQFPAPRQELRRILVRVIGNSGEILTRGRGNFIKLQFHLIDKPLAKLRARTEGVALSTSRSPVGDAQSAFRCAIVWRAFRPVPLLVLRNRQADIPVS